MMPNNAINGLDPERCWEAVQKRDALQDGTFLYGVMTTGVYCRPGCAARLPRRENVSFYASAKDAERDGLRPCLRCKPLALEGADSWGKRIAALCRYIEQNADQPLTLADLSRKAHLSPEYLQRRFQAIVGISPKQYLDEFRLRNFKGILRKQGDEGVTGAIYEAGFGSSSRVYEKADTRLGMTPMEYRSGGRCVSISYAVSETPVGMMMVGATDRGLCFLQFGDDAAALLAALKAEYLEARAAAMEDPAPPQYREWMTALNEHLEGHRSDLRLPVHVAATAFQMKVWKYLQSIPGGSVQSYAEVAEGIGQPRAARAVARACATNRVALAIPCHRVIRGTGELGGYRWGLERKRLLIDRERAAHTARSQSDAAAK